MSLPHHKPARLALAVPAALLALTLSACGGGDDSTGSTGSTGQPTPSSKNASPTATTSQAEAASGGDVATGESVTGKVAEEEGEVTYEITAENAPGCEDLYDIESWKAGESHTVCTTYQVPAAAKDIQVHWSQEDGEPYVWTFPKG
ncbi:hypothetical protein ACIOJD_23335 [Streptomyces sp. NPDC088116]|uniref:hypothetical protein n=1 Tax=Streptomyces sp. NPDC088116 TaxID=3365825 RepID=UPI0037FDBFCC